jgi:hypothetical protein
MHRAVFYKLSSSLKAIDLKKDLCMNMPLTFVFYFHGAEVQMFYN